MRGEVGGEDTESESGVGESVMSKFDTQQAKSTAAEKSVAVFIYQLATGNEFYDFLMRVKEEKELGNQKFRY